MAPDELFTRDEVLRGLPARRARAAARSGIVRYGMAYIGKLTNEYLGAAGAGLFTLAVLLLYLVTVMGGFFAISRTLAQFTERTIARHRPAVPIIAVTYVEPTYRRLALTWGVIPFLTDRFTTSEEMIRRAIGAATAAGLVRSGDRVVITAGLPMGQAGQTNMVQVQEVGIVAT